MKLCNIILGLILLCFVGFSPVFAQTVSVDGLTKAVVVQRDSRSIPYINAENDADLYFMQGYVTASDRLWQMDLLRRLARGQTAEIFGNATLAQDKHWRTYGFSKIAAENMKNIGAEAREALESYAKGVNAYIATLGAKDLPVEFQILQYSPANWTPEDTIVIGKILAEALSSTYSQDLLRASMNNIDAKKLKEIENIVTPYDVVLFGSDNKTAEKSTLSECTLCPAKSVVAVAAEQDKLRENSLRSVGLYAEGLAASNNWVISGNRTASGKPILANDPHLQAAAPGIWYMTHLSTPTMRVSGVTFPGVPGIVLGHNENFAWGATNVGPDVQDIYLETFDDKGNYKTPEGTAKPNIRHEVIKVRNSPGKPETSGVAFDVTETRNGPIVVEADGKRYALKWTALDPKKNDLEAFFLINRAKDWGEFTKALKGYGGATQNFVYADTKGNIGWYAAGRIPIRRTGDGALPYDGSTNAGDWVGEIPFDELPHLYNPTSGFIVTANQRIVGTNYKYTQVSRDAASPWRARRIYDLLKDKTKVTMDDVRDIQYDVFNQPVSNIAKAVVEAKAASDETIAILKDWNGHMEPGSQEALIANGIRNCLADTIAAQNEPVPAYVIRERILDRAIAGKESIWLPKEFNDYSAFMKNCSDGTEAGFQKQFGGDRENWVWGKIFVTNFPHPLAAVPFIGSQFSIPKTPIAGSGQTPNVGSSVSMRHIAMPGNWDETRLIIPLGQSGNPRSKFYKDQLELWKTGRPAIFPFSKEAVKEAAVETFKYEPKAH